MQMNVNEEEVKKILKYCCKEKNILFYNFRCKKDVSCFISIKDNKNVHIVNINKNYNELLNYVDSNNINLICYMPVDEKMVQDVFWSSNKLTISICIDDNSFKNSGKTKSKLMNEKLWNFTANNANDMIEAGGWINSYTREKFSEHEMQEYTENTFIKLSPHLNNDCKVLEIGCSSGLTMYNIAPFAKSYFAIDLSKIIIKKNQEYILKNKIDNIKLFCLKADEIDAFINEKFDIVILNSVIHCFSDYIYFEDVMKKILKITNDNAVVFLGDILDLDKRVIFEKSLIEYREKCKKTKIDFTNELFLSKKYLEDFAANNPRIQKIEFSSKCGKIKNELTEFRYDALLKLNDSTESSYHKKKHRLFCKIGTNIKSEV